MWETLEWALYFLLLVSLGAVLRRSIDHLLEYSGVPQETCTVIISQIDSVTEYFFSGSDYARYRVDFVVHFPGQEPFVRPGFHPWHIIRFLKVGQTFALFFRRSRGAKKPRIFAIRCV